MVASADNQSTIAGLAMLRQGGNAVDAAVATTLAISVVEPFSAGIGGGGFLLLGRPSPEPGVGYQIQALDFRERAPIAATPDMYLDATGQPQPGASLDGHLAAGVPGTIAGLYTVHRFYGQLPWIEVVQPAINLAENGFPVGESLTRSIRQRLPIIASNPAARRIFTQNGQPYQPGDILIQQDLAQTLRQIAQEPRSFYQGRIAQAIAQDMKNYGGLITLEDLNVYTPIWRSPLCGEFRQAQVCSMPPPSSGGVHLLEMLNMIEPQDLKAWGPGHPNTLHWLTEVMRIAYADRAEYLGDPDFVAVPVGSLTSRGYARERLKTINPNRAQPFQQIQPASLEQIQRYRWESPETSHLTVVDAARNVVSLTFTINTGFGAGVVAAGTGIVLNNEMDDFAIAPGVPNAFGLVGGAANQIAPKKTPLSSMTPTIVTRDGKLLMATGTPGGSTIITTVLQVVLNVLEFGFDAETAVSAPRIHHQWLPDRLMVEKGRMDSATLNELKRRGHSIIEQEGWGNANIILVTPQGDLEGAADPRQDGAAEGF
ncbi:MAG: gamma-glutamyltransferase [Oscillatoriales cyanobacterium SM2_3_0]|nr:gamma-glutamyltransferase [Oscillatoriales cyanobacterium SM2_3_0]